MENFQVPAGRLARPAACYPEPPSPSAPAMQRLIRTLLDLLTFRAGPQDFPYSPGLATATGGAFLATGAIAVLPVTRLSVALAQTALELGLMSGLLYAVLSLSGRAQRFLQAFTALTALGTAMQVAAWPLTALAYPQGAAQPQSGPLLVLLVLLFWNLALIAHILRLTLETTPFRAVAMTLLYYLTLVMIAAALFGTPEGG